MRGSRCERSRAATNTRHRAARHHRTTLQQRFARCHDLPYHEGTTMQRIHRSLRNVAVAIVSALLIACGSDGATAPRRGVTPPPADSLPTLPPDTTPTAPSPIVGTWTSVRIN